MENRINAYKWFVCAALVLALISFFMPFMSTGRYYTYSSTGYELLTMAMEDGEADLFILALISTFIGTVISLMHPKNNAIYAWLLILSLVSGASMWFNFSECMDYVTNGFWMFIIAHVATVVICGMICSSAKSSAENTEATDKEQTNG